MPVGSIRAGASAGVGLNREPQLQGIARCQELAQRGITRLEQLDPLLNPMTEPEPECWKRAKQVNASTGTLASLFTVIRDAARTVGEGPQSAAAKEIVTLCDRAERNDAGLAEQLPYEESQRHIFQYVGIVDARKANALNFMKDILARCEA